MKKRILSLLLAIFTLLHVMPWSVLDFVAESYDEEEYYEDYGLDVEDMIVGVPYSAELSEYAIWKGSFIPLKPDPENPWELIGPGYPDYSTSSYLRVSYCPQELKVVRVSEEDISCVYVLNEDWPAEFDEYRYIDMEDIKILDRIYDDPSEEFVYGEVKLTVNGEEVSSVTIKKAEKVYVFTELSDVFDEDPSYSWQILVDDDKWANIQNYCAHYAPVSEALVLNGENDGSSKLRCIAALDGVNYVSDEIEIFVDRGELASFDMESYIPLDKLDEIYYNQGEGAVIDEEPSDDEESSDGDSEETPDDDSEGDPALIDDSNDPQVNDTDEAFQITVNYVYWNASTQVDNLHGETAHPSFTVTILPGGEYDDVRNHPYIPGYKAYVRVAEGEDVPEGAISYVAPDPDNSENVISAYYMEAQPVVFENETKERSETVYYIPVDVTFTVNHHFQNLYDDEYTVHKTVHMTGISDSPVGDGLYLTSAVDPEIVGYTELYYDVNTRISRTGNTIVDIYYDRNYYLIDFDLTTPDGSEGYGVVPLYVRYETVLQLGSPTAPGYNFNGWTLTSVKDENGTELLENNSISSMYTQTSQQLNIKHNLSYEASWAYDTTTYTVIYWLENADSNDASNVANYSIWHTKVMNATPGSNTIAGGDHIKNYITGNALTEINKDYPFLSYEADLTDTVPKAVSADGTTTVNVYYKRNEYTLRFYYARKHTSNNSQWEIGARTDGFGNENNGSNNYRDDDLHLLGRAQWGTVLDEPLLKNNVATEKGYTTDSLVYDSYTYKYFEFQAKYGQDIGDKWPIDIMNTPRKNSSGSKAVMSAWTGEYNVRHQHDNPNGTANQTIKGKYEVLDEYLMWDPKYSGWNNKDYNDGTIAFLCFWENAANLGWNVPELYRYKIWLPVLEGKTYPATKVINGFEYKATLDENGDGNIDYYLEDVYDTCDNSTVGEQTQPALTGYTSLKRVNVPNIPSNYESNEDYNHSYHLYVTGLTFNNLSNNKYTTEAEFNKIISYKNNPYVRAYIVNYFYSRSQNYLILNDNAGTTPTEIPLAYGASISQYDVDPSYPSTYESGNYVFIDWYQDESGTVEFDFSQTMPNKNLQAYAKWEPTYWDVTFYLNENCKDSEKLDSFTNVPFGTILSSLGSEPDRTPPTEGYIFAGWYYKDGKTEKRFDFNTMPVKGDLEIYAKWTSRVPVPFTVKYYTVIDGQRVEIADQTTGVSLAGVSKSFVPKVNNELYEGYRVGYFPTHSEMTEIMKPSGNDFEFIYKTPTQISYTVKHIFSSEGIENVTGSESPLELSWTQTVTASNTNAQLTFNFEGLINKDSISKCLKDNEYSYDVDDLWQQIILMSPDALSKKLILTTEGSNVVVFNWTGDITMAVYEVHHMYESLSGGYEEGPVHTIQKSYDPNQNIQANFSISPAKGFKCTKFNTNVNSTYQDLNSDGTPVGSYPQLFIPEGDGNSFGVGLIIYVYYEREEYDYTVRFLDYNNYTVVYEDIEHEAKYEQEIKISDVAVDLQDEGYELQNGSSTYKITDDGQIIICYYVKQRVTYYYSVDAEGGLNTYPMSETIIITDSPSGSTPTAKPGYIFDKWLYVDPITYDTTVVTSEIATVDPDTGHITPIPSENHAGKEIYFIAYFKPTELTIKNSISGSAPTWVTNDQGFIYRIRNDELSVDLRVAVIDSVTILGLPLDIYYIEIENDWSWRYRNDWFWQSAKASGSDGTDCTIDFDGSDSVSFSYVVPDTDLRFNGYYRTDEAHN